METTIDNSKFRGLATVVEMMMDVNCPTNLQQSIDNSKFRGLATVVEMMMYVNCPTNLQQSEGLGTDNMTAILIEFNKQ